MRAVAFDLDGTLFDHEAAARAAIRQWIAAKGWPDRTDAEEQWFVIDHLLATSELPAFKPDPRAYQALCAALALDADDVAYVGDDIFADAHGARDAGLRAIHLDRSGEVGPIPGTTRIRTLADLLELLH